jgi:hypothetical protein
VKCVTVYAGKRPREANPKSGAKNDGRLGVGGNISVAWSMSWDQRDLDFSIVNGIAKVNRNVARDYFRAWLGGTWLPLKYTSLLFCVCEVQSSVCKS